MMARRCSICHHVQRDEIDAALVEGMPYRKIAARWGVSSAALSRHLRHHLVAILAGRDEVTADNLLARVNDLQRQAQAIKDKALETGDLKTALAGIRELTRLTNLFGKLCGELSSQPVVNVLVSPDYVHAKTVIMDALEPWPDARAAAAAALLEVDARG